MATGSMDPFTGSPMDTRGSRVGTQRPFVVVDIDGCLVPDIDAKLGSMLRRTGSAIEKAYEETIYHGLSVLSRMVRGVACKIDVRMQFDDNFVKALKEAQDMGYRTVAATSNSSYDDEALNEVASRLVAAGINDPLVVRRRRGHKADRINGMLPSLIMDDIGMECANSARNGVPSLLKKDGYQAGEGRVLPHLNVLIRSVRGEDMKDAVRDVLEQTKDVRAETRRMRGRNVAPA